MASEEKYLWVFTFELHTRWHIWCAYFPGQQEAEDFVQSLLSAIPCVHLLALEEYTHGLLLRGHLFPYRYSHMKRDEGQCEQPMHRQDLQMFPIAPLTSGYLTSLLSRLGRARYCPQCEGKWLMLEESVGFAHRRYVKSAGKRQSAHSNLSPQRRA